MSAALPAPDAVATCRTDSAEPASRLIDGKGPADVNDTDTVEGSATGADIRTQWLEWRRSGIGASDVPVICGLSPWGSPWQVWADKLDRIPPQEADARMKAGNRLEPVITAMLTEDEGMFIGGEQMMCAHKEHAHHLATIDALRLDGPNSQLSDALGVVEYKFLSEYSHWETIPDHYMVQVQWQLHVTGFDRAWLACLRQGYDLKVYEIQRDQAVVDALTKIVNEFWALVQTETPPEPDDREATGKALAAFYPQSQKAEQVIPDALAAELAMAKEAKVAAEARFDLVANQIKGMLGENDTAVIPDGTTVATWRTQNTSNVDLKRLREAHPAIVAEFTTVSTLRKFLPKGPK